MVRILPYTLLDSGGGRERCRMIQEGSEGERGRDGRQASEGQRRESEGSEGRRE